MKFLADMGISPKSVAFLSSLGHDARHLQDERLHRLPDREILEKTLLEGRVLITHDLEFGDLMAASRARLPSLIIFRLRNMHPARVNRYLQEIVEEHQDALKRGAILSVTERRIRVRQLPLTASGQ